MTFEDIVSEVMERLNLTSMEARERIERRVNTRYRKVTTSIGLQTSRRAILDLTVDPTDTATYPSLPELTVTGLEKILKITMNDANNGGVTVLKEKTYDDITMIATNDRVPRAWAVKLMGPSEVVIVLDAYPAATSFDIHVEGYEIAMDMQGTQEPYFPEDFHDILVEGAMADEYLKMEKPQLAAEREVAYQQRLSDLRFFISKSAFVDIVQGKNKPGFIWHRPWISRTGIT